MKQHKPKNRITQTRNGRYVYMACGCCRCGIPLIYTDWDGTEKCRDHLLASADGDVMCIDCLQPAQPADGATT